ncbi:MAG: heavy-metal-associated domain-containing protein [Usitatibacteraceae bacterium]
MIEMNIEDMTCGGCVASITRVVKNLDPNAEVNADVASKRVKIDSVIEAESVVAAITHAGYHPVPISA